MVSSSQSIVRTAQVKQRRLTASGSSERKDGVFGGKYSGLGMT